jgi:oligoribonuclease NrnB/cAMP/cGMP phosphodiesterase (DHH superfamily)
VVILDHHKTAFESLPQNGQGPGNLHCVLDMNRSGATISYDYFERKLLSERNSKGPPLSSEQISLVPGSNSERVKGLFKYIEDADLWKWNLSDSKAFSSGLSDMCIEFSAVANQQVFDQASLKLKPLFLQGSLSLMTSKRFQCMFHRLTSVLSPHLVGFEG